MTDQFHAICMHVFSLVLIKPLGTHWALVKEKCLKKPHETWWSKSWLNYIFFVRGTFLRALGKQLVLVAVFIMKLICLSNEKGLRYFPQIMLFIRNLWVRCLDYLPLFGERACAHRLSLLSKSRHFLLRRQKKKIRDYYVVFHCQERRCTLISRPLTANYFIS